MKYNGPFRAAIEAFIPKYLPLTKGNVNVKWYDRITMLHISDSHVSTAFSIDNLTESVEVGNCLAELNACQLVANTGDNSTGGDAPKQGHLKQLDHFAGISVQSSIPVLNCLGNHDANDGFRDSAKLSDVPTQEELYQHAFAPLKAAYPQLVFGPDHARYCYCDISASGWTLRVIMLDMLDHADYTEKSVYDAQWNAVYSQQQIDWLCNTALQVGDHYGIVIGNHFPFAPYRDAGYSEEWAALQDAHFAHGWKMIPEIIDAWQNRTSIHKLYPDQDGAQNINADYDFSDIPDSSMFCCYLTGHTHSKNVYKVRAEDGTEFNQLMLCEDSSGQLSGELNRVCKFPGTPLSNAFSLLSFDLNEKKIYRAGYGAYVKCSDMDTKQIQVFDIL